MAKHRKNESRLWRGAFLLWVAVLSFALPEVFAGTGKNWPVRIDVFLLALPLYALHFLLLCHIAIRTGRTSWPALYVWGVIFALYESWITKVIWAGYPDQGTFAMGGFGSFFGVHETLGLTLFYHPVTSFLLPLAVMTRVFPAYGAHFPVPDWVFGNSRGALWRRLGLVAIWASVSGFNMPDVVAYLFTWLSTILILWLGYGLLRRAGVLENTRVTSPLLDKAGLIIAIIWLALIYGVSYGHLRPVGLPPVSAQMITLAFYPVLLLFLWRLPRRRATPPAPLAIPARLPFRWLLIIGIAGLPIAILRQAGVTEITAPVGLIFAAMIPLGTGLFIWLLYNLLRAGSLRKEAQI